MLGRLARHGSTGSVTLKRTTDRLATISFENQGKKNALSAKMMVELSECVEELKTNVDSTVGLILHGTKDFFCSGADLSAFKNSFTQEDGEAMVHLMQHSLSALSSLPLISVAVMQGGGCIGGGSELALSCDFRVMEETARFRMVQPTLGLTPGWGGGARLVNVVGRKNAIKLLCSSQWLDAEECMKIGIADVVQPNGLVAAEEFLKPFLDMPYPVAVQKNKEVIDINQLQFERDTFVSVWGGKENKDALSKLK